MTPATIPLPDPTAARRVELAADGAMSVADAAAFLSLCVRQVERLLDAGELVGGRLRRRRVVSRVSAREYLAARLDVTPPTEG